MHMDKQIWVRVANLDDGDGGNGGAVGLGKIFFFFFLKMWKRMMVAVLMSLDRTDLCEF